MKLINSTLRFLAILILYYILMVFIFEFWSIWLILILINMTMVVGGFVSVKMHKLQTPK